MTKSADIPAPTTTARGGNPTVKKLRNMKEGDRLPAQAQVILALLDKAKGKSLSQTEVISGLKGQGLKTVQTPKRIFTFYRKRLVDEGYISVTA